MKNLTKVTVFIQEFWRCWYFKLCHYKYFAKWKYTYCVCNFSFLSYSPNSDNCQRFKMIDTYNSLNLKTIRQFLAHDIMKRKPRKLKITISWWMQIEKSEGKKSRLTKTVYILSKCKEEIQQHILEADFWLL